VKPFLAVVGGFVVALGTFAGGALVAFMVLKTEPSQALAAGDDTQSVWSSKPRRVDVDAQEFERVASIVEIDEKDQAEAARQATEVDAMTTASLRPMDGSGTPEPAVVDEREASLIAGHVDWCYRKYRSYDADTNTYQPYRGGRRDCVSPHLEELEALTAGGRPGPAAPGQQAGEAFAQVEERPAIVEADADGGLLLQVADRDGRRDAARMPQGRLSPAHVRDCFSRYRSYDPATNSYQPYGGGPRRLCE
jgi:hypothetical protein